MALLHTINVGTNVHMINDRTVSLDDTAPANLPTCPCATIRPGRPVVVK